MLSSLLYSSALNMYELSTKQHVTTALEKITYLCTYALTYILYNDFFSKLDVFVRASLHMRREEKPH